MIDIVDRLRFDATRCELQFSKGVAGNINEAADEIERLRRHAQGARNPELVQSILTRVVDLPHFKNNQIEALVRDAKDALAELEAVCAPALTSTPGQAIENTDGGAS